MSNAKVKYGALFLKLMLFYLCLRVFGSSAL